MLVGGNMTPMRRQAYSKQALQASVLTFTRSKLPLGAILTNVGAILGHFHPHGQLLQGRFSSENTWF